MLNTSKYLITPRVQGTLRWHGEDVIWAKVEGWAGLSWAWLGWLAPSRHPPNSTCYLSAPCVLGVIPSIIPPSADRGGIL